MALAALALWLVPGRAYADPPHAHGGRGHFAAGQGPRRGDFRGSRGHGPVRGGHWAGRGGYAAWHSGPPARSDWHGPGDRYGGWRGDHHADRADRRGGWDGEQWRTRGWDRGDWDHEHWRGALWVGGDWGGLYWPPVNYGWNYPWFMAAVPLGALSITFGGVPYYYVNHVYYSWSPYYGGYVVTDPPPVAGAAGEAAAGPPPPGSDSAAGGGGVLALQVTPLKGQNAQQAANDRYECNRWAVAQSGFNPVSAQQDAQASPQARDEYRRAFTACLQARGYRVQ